MHSIRRVAVLAALGATTIAVVLVPGSASSEPTRHPHPTPVAAVVPPPSCSPVIATLTLDPGLLVRDDTVKALQGELASLGVDLGPSGTDGVYGPATATAEAAVPLTGVLVDDPEFLLTDPCIPMVDKVYGQPFVTAVDGLAGVQDQLTAAVLAARAARPKAPASSPAPSAASGSGDVSAFLACTRNIESHGNYEDVDSTQTYWGAYQFDQGTWNGAVARAGYPQYVGQPPNGAPPAVQDAAATQLYSERGNQPWGGRC